MPDKTFNCKTLCAPVMTRRCCVLRHRRANLQDVYHQCRDCYRGKYHEAAIGSQVVKAQHVIKEPNRLEIPAWEMKERNMWGGGETLYTPAYLSMGRR